MSASAGSIPTLLTATRKLFRSCRAAGGEYLEISSEVKGLHTVIKHLRYETEAPESILNRDRNRYSRELSSLTSDCDFTLGGLEKTLEKYGRLDDDNVGLGEGNGRQRDKGRFGTRELDDLGAIRMKLISHKTDITVFLDKVQLYESGKQACFGDKLDKQSEQLDVILDKVDRIAARMSQRAPSVLSNYDDDQKEVWKQFRKELVAEGFSSDVLQHHKEVLRAYIRQIEQDGLLQEPVPLSDLSARPTVDPVRWHETAPPVQSPMTGANGVLPPSSSIALSSESSDSKMLMSEGNVKYPQSIKADMARDQNVVDGGTTKQAFDRARYRPANPKDSQSTERQLPIRSTPQTQTILEDESRPYSSSSNLMTTMSTLDLFPPPPPPPPAPMRKDHSTQNKSQDKPDARPPLGSFSSYKNHTAESMDPRISSTSAYKVNPVNTEPARYGSSPRASFQRSTPLLPSESASRSLNLAPDQNGNQIPMDARWTKVKRVQVSPEILARDGKRFEVRGDFVAVLGLLSREEIQEYAVRTLDLRQSRARPKTSALRVRPCKPRRRNSQRSSSSDDYTERDTSDSCSESESESGSESDGERDCSRRSRNRHVRSRDRRNSTADTSPNSRRNVQPPQKYPQSRPIPYVKQPPNWSGVAAQAYPQQSSYPSNQPSSPGDRRWSQPSPVPQQRVRFEDDRRRSMPQNQSGQQQGSKAQQQPQQQAPQPAKKKSSWRNGLTGAGVGIAAGSMLGVLLEAAQDF